MIADRPELNESAIARIMQQLLSAIVYCHSRHIVHRYLPLTFPSDIKPENILLIGHDEHISIKVIDFGRSKILRPFEQLTELAGSVAPPYSIYTALLYRS